MNKRNSTNLRSINTAHALFWPVSRASSGELEVASAMIGQASSTDTFLDPIQSHQVATEKADVVSNASTDWLYITSQVATEYAIDKPNEVLRFFAENPDLPAILVEALTHIRNAFGLVKTRLEIETDYDGNGGNKLWGNIASSEESFQALERMNIFENSWLIPQLDRFVGRLNFSLDFTK